MCKQCARGGCAFYFRNRGAPTNRALASACSPAPTTPNYSQLGFRAHPPTPLKGGFLALCFPSQLCRKCACHSKTELRWITVGLWVFAACAGRSTRSKGSQQTLRLSHPVRVARKQSKACGRNRLNWRGRPLRPAQKAPKLGPAKTAPGICQAGAPDPPKSTPQTLPGQTQKNNIGFNGFGVLLYCLTARGQRRSWVTTGLVYREALPSLTVLTGRSSVGASNRA